MYKVRECSLLFLCTRWDFHFLELSVCNLLYCSMLINSWLDCNVTVPRVPHKRSIKVSIWAKQTAFLTRPHMPSKDSDQPVHLHWLIHLDVCFNPSIAEPGYVLPFWRSQLIWICTVCYSVFEFVLTMWIKQSDWPTIGSGCGILVYSVWQGLRGFGSLAIHRVPYKHSDQTGWILFYYFIIFQSK